MTAQQLVIIVIKRVISAKEEEQHPDEPKSFTVSNPQQFLANQPTSNTGIQPQHVQSNSTSIVSPPPQFSFQIPASIFSANNCCTTLHLAALAASFETGSTQNSDIATDNCATYNLWIDRHMFTECYSYNDKKMFVTSFGGARMRILGFGAVGNLHHIFHVERLVKNVLGYHYTGSAGECTLYERDGVTKIWKAKITDSFLLPKLDPDVLYSSKLSLTMPNGDAMMSTPEAMGLQASRS